jgi:hypothetical protein
MAISRKPNEIIVPATVHFTPEPDIFQSKIAFKVTIARPYSEVTAVLSYPTVFFPFISSAFYGFPDNYHHSRLQQDDKNSLLNESFRVIKVGMEPAPVQYKYITVTYTIQGLTLITLQDPAHKVDSSFDNFYNAIHCSVNPLSPDKTDVQVETGFSISGLAKIFGADISLGIISDTIHTTLERIEQWMTVPHAALRQRLLRMQLIKANPPGDTKKKIEYNASANFNCSSEQIMSVLSKPQQVVTEIFCADSYKPDFTAFTHAMPIVGDIELTSTKSNSLLYKGGTFFNNVSVQFSVLENRVTATTSTVEIKTAASFTKDSVAELRVFFKDYMANWSATLTSRLAGAVQRKFEIAEITPELANDRSIPVELIEGLGFKNRA